MKRTVLDVRNARIRQSQAGRRRAAHGRVRPGTISACLIVRDEERMLPGCIESLRGAVDEIVVADTGSCDGTRRLARHLGARVFSVPWGGDFGAARNAAMDHATGEWLLTIDADERLCRADGRVPVKGELWPAIAAADCDAYALRLINFDDLDKKLALDEHSLTRLVRNDPALRYTNRVHEVLTLPPDARVLGLPGFELHHLGYVSAVIADKDKIERNRRLIEAELERDPGSAMMHFYLGREFHRMTQPERAVEEYRRAWTLLGPARPPYWGELAAFMARALIALARADEAIRHCDEVLADWPHFADLWLHRGQALRLKGDMAGGLASLYKALATHETNPWIPLHQKIVPAVAWSDIGLCYEDLGDRPKAVAAYLEALRAWPRVGGTAVEHLGRLLLGQGDSAEAFEQAVLQAAGEDEAVILAALREAFFSAHDFSRALTWADRSVRADPSPKNRRRRADVLLYLGLHAEFVEALDACGGTVEETAWLRGLALLASGDAAEADRMLARCDPANRLARAGRLLAAYMLDPAAATGRGDPEIVVGLWELAGQLASARGFQPLQALLALAVELGQPREQNEANLRRILAAHGYLPPLGEGWAAAG